MLCCVINAINYPASQSVDDSLPAYAFVCHQVMACLATWAGIPIM